MSAKLELSRDAIGNILSALYNDGEPMSLIWKVTDAGEFLGVILFLEGSVPPPGHVLEIIRTMRSKPR